MLPEERHATKPRRTKSWARLAAGMATGLTLLIAAALLYCVAMPGDSFTGPAPRPSAAEQQVATELRAHVSALAVEIGQRRATFGDSLQRAEQYITGELGSLAVAGALRREPLAGAPGNPANVVLELPGTRAGPIVLLGAHYDTDQGGTPGANDNGSGVATALVLAKRLSAAKHALPIRIVLFANEEQPYFATSAMGSLQHAQGCRKRGEQLRAMLSLETMGYYSDEPRSQKYPAPLSALYPDRGNFIGFVANLGSRGLLRDVMGRFRQHATIPSEGAALPEALPGVGWSDHWAFWREGYEAIMVTDTALFRDPTYHRHSDIAPNLDYERLARVAVGLERVVLELASE
ncbi:MAG TPA: M28 family peptidase [Polyangiaceae bacterium]